jgi:hypothetical protein
LYFLEAEFFKAEDRFKTSPNSSLNCAPEGLQNVLSAPLIPLKKRAPDATRRLLTDGL